MQNEVAWSIPANNKDRSVDWFWAIGLITLVGAGVAFFVGNSLFGIFILLGGSLLFFTNLRHGEDTTVHINEKEITVNELHYISKKMKGYAVVKNSAEDNVLIIHTDRFFMPMLILHIPESISVGEVEELVSKRIPKEDLREPPANVLADKLGF